MWIFLHCVCVCVDHILACLNACPEVSLTADLLPQENPSSACEVHIAETRSHTMFCEIQDANTFSKGEQWALASALSHR